MKSALLIDIGSTFTKALLIDLQQQRVMGRGRAYTTIDRDVTLGLKQALSGLTGWEQAQYRLACSSAAGGLKLIAIGLVPDLTAEAARRAALGAGSKVLKTYSYELSSQELEQIRALEPDIILLAGGTDGGNREVILNNARKLAGSPLEVPIIVAGNKVVNPEVASILRKRGKQPYVTENVMPALEELNITPARKLIREIFLENIIEAKGLDRVKEIIEGVIMPTPAAVLKAAALLAEGHGTEPGLGELLVLDIGGATTDVHSLASGNPTNTGVNWRGLEEPFQKRTVEGDLGMRYSAPGLYRAVGRDKILNHLQKRGLELEAEELDSYIKKIHHQVDYLPNSRDEALIDRVLARQAVRIAVA
ncbi:MAG: methylaspartate mutase accessory protein GlmL, partial [Bacillota bacterium]